MPKAHAKCMTIFRIQKECFCNIEYLSASNETIASSKPDSIEGKVTIKAVQSGKIPSPWSEPNALRHLTTFVTLEYKKIQNKVGQTDEGDAKMFQFAKNRAISIHCGVCTMQDP